MIGRILVVKLADMGDVLTVTPSLRALRSRYPAARIEVLTTAIGAAALAGLDSVDDLLVFPKHEFDTFRGAARPRQIARMLGLARELRVRRYDAAVLCHHLTTRWGTLKYASLMLATGAPRRIGLDNGRGWFLTEFVRDDGFGARHEVDYWLALVERLDARTAHPRLEVMIPPDARSAADDLVCDLPDPIVVIHPGSGSYSVARRWPVERFAEVAARLAEDGARVVVVGSGDETPLAQELIRRCDAPIHDLSGRTDLKTLAAVLGRARVLVSNDSGVMHLAVAVGTPVVAVFGLSNARAWGPYGSVTWTAAEPRPGLSTGTPGVVVRRDLPCSPCFYRGHELGWRNGCATRHCLTELGSEAVVAAARHFLSEAQKRVRR